MSALLQIARAAPKALRASTQTFRCMSSEGSKAFSDRESAYENVYFTKEDQRIFSKLMSKVKQQSDALDKHGAAGVKAAELSALKEIIGKYKISSEDIDKIMSWKHTAY